MSVQAADEVGETLLNSDVLQALQSGRGGDGGGEGGEEDEAELITQAKIGKEEFTAGGEACEAIS